MSAPKYSEDLRAPVDVSVNDAPKVKVHRVEWAKVSPSDVLNFPHSNTKTAEPLGLEQHSVLVDSGTFALFSSC